jgi:RNA polymerase sigma-70 factor (ECF subfamily)
MEQSYAAAVALARAGDPLAFRQLVERHSRAIFRLAFRITANEQDAEDVVQETFLKLHRNLEKFEDRASLSTWLYRIATNTALDLIRGRKRHQQGREPEDEQGVAAVDKLATEAPAPDRLMLSSELRERVSAALGRLSPAERAAFVLRHFEGLGIETIAATLGLRQGAAKNTIFRAVQKLRGELEVYAAASE